LKDGIGLRAMAQRDPLIEYQREGYALFNTMMGQIKEDTTGFVYNLDVQVQAPEVGMAAQVSAQGLAQSVVPQQNLSYSAPSADGSVEVRNQKGQVVNSPSPAGSAFGVATPTASQQPASPTARPVTQPPPSRPAPPAANRAQRRAQKKKKR